MEELLPIKPRIPFEDGRDRPGPLMREDGQGVALALFMLQASQIGLPQWMVPPQQDSSFRDGPLEMGMAHLRASGPGALARRLLGTFDEATVGHDILDPGEAGNVLHLVE